MSSFVARSIKEVHDLTDSNLRVSEGFIIGRQLKHIMMQTSCTRNVIRTAWAEDDLQCETAIRILESIPREPGYPAVKLSSIVSASIQQTLMDKAKHAVSTDKRRRCPSVCLRLGPISSLQ
ncbi:unnamed protein product [Peronospora belbahrii]|uniref:Uncharacterized protein n=1 Tax=Peronospora belbahrii TaxID=622444 RepID=A0AAU9LE99_9STRA|nr:unnamed protein product [Peronospora belbahrii]